MTSFDPAVERLLRHMVAINASDLYLVPGAPPVFRVEGVSHRARTVLDPTQVEQMASSMMTPDQRDAFAKQLEMNLALTLDDAERFRVNVFRQRGATTLVVRRLRNRVPALDELGLPPALKKLAAAPRGLVLVVGVSGSGKSTTLAAMIEHRNAHHTGHITTIEDPIEYVFAPKSSLVTQREVGVDTLSCAEALRNALRQAPDMVVVGEVRDRGTMDAVLTVAETGHLCVTTLHATNAAQAVERVLRFYPAERRDEIGLQLALNLRAVVAQRLVSAVGGKRVVAVEVLVDTPRVRGLLKRLETDALREAMEQSAHEGCRTFDAALYDLVVAGRITPETALETADFPNDLRLRLDRLRESARPPDAEDRPLRFAAEPSRYPGPPARGG